MKMLLLLWGLMVILLSGCYVIPYNERDDGYHRDRDHRPDSHDGRPRGRDRYP